MSRSNVLHADVAIVGAGVIGLSIAFHLLLQDRKLKVVVVEKESLAGSASTAKATGGIRQQFGSEALVELSRRSIGEYRNFRTLTGVDLEFANVGYLLFSTSEHGSRELMLASLVQAARGVKTESFGPDEIRTRWPFLEARDILTATFTPEDGHGNPYSAVMGYLSSFRAMGGTVLFGEPVVSCGVVAGRVTSVQTHRQIINTPIVVNAAGIHASKIAELLGSPLPVRAFRRQVVVLTAALSSYARVPFLMDSDSGWYLHKQNDGTILLGGTDEDTHPGTAEVIDPAVTLQFIEVGMGRVPSLAESSLVRAYVGLRALTPDGLPILGPIPQVDGAFSACGLAGHGFMHAPAVGEALANWILKGNSGMAILDSCRPDRFRGVEEWRELEVLG
jgi:sarcosine oxidase subunit beta